MSSAAPVLDVDWDFRTENLEAYRTRVATLLRPFSLTGRSGGYYDARLAHRRLWHCEISIIGYGEEVAVDAETMKDFYLLQMPLCGGYSIAAQGRTAVVREGQAHLIHEAMPLRMAFSQDLSLLVLKFDKRNFAAMAAGEYRRRSVEQQRFGYLLPLDRGRGAFLRRAVEFVAGETMAPGTLIDQPETRHHAEELLLAAILGGFQIGFEHPRQAAVPSYVRRAEDFIDDHIGDSFTLDDIVSASGVSARTLFYGFQNVHGIGPWAWARTRRLEEARQALLSGGRSSRVTDIALDWGFSHLGRFSAAYRLQFGETPSETLARTSGKDILPA